eukprot:Rhum_TRINITY_DN14277_c3_g2::Rhum_TRINITY_DN14277_c3_g2_i1::g.77809::m.77809
MQHFVLGVHESPAAYAALAMSVASTLALLVVVHALRRVKQQLADRQQSGKMCDTAVSVQDEPAVGVVPQHIVVNGTATLQEEINNLPPTGGLVTLDSNTKYLIAATVTVYGRQNVTIVGDRSSVLQWTGSDDGANPPAMVVVNKGSFVTLRGFSLQSANIVVLESSNCVFDGLSVAATSGSSILLDGQHGAGSHYNTVSGCVCTKSARVGISQNMVKDSKILNNKTFDNNFEGLTIDNASDRCIVIGNYIGQNRGGVGEIGLDFSTNCTIQGNVIEGGNGAKSGITFQNNIAASNANNITGNVFKGSPEYGVHFKTGNNQGCSQNIVSNNQFVDNALGGMKIDTSASKDNVVTGNNFGGKAFVNGGARTVFANNVGVSP